MTVPLDTHAILTLFAIMGGLGGGTYWALKRVREVAEDVVGDVKTAFDFRLSKLESDYAHLKRNLEMQSEAVRAHMEKHNDQLGEIRVNMVRLEGDMVRFMERSDLQNQMKVEALARIESKLGDAPK